jgi:hypothetical protein
MKTLPHQRSYIFVLSGVAFNFGKLQFIITRIENKYINVQVQKQNPIWSSFPYQQ